MSQANDALRLQATLKAEKDFQGKLFLVCGASSGIGFAVAQELAKQGAALVILSRGGEKLENARKSLLQTGAPEVILAPFDISHPDTAKNVRNLIGSRSLRGLLLNSGGPHGGRFSSLSWNDFETAHHLLLAGPANLLIGLADCLESPGGSVVAITSTTVKQPNADLILSAAYRSGLVAFLKHVADELGPKGIRVNNVAPGFTDTDRLSELAEYQAQKLYGSQDASILDQIRKKWEEASPLKRMADPAEIARTCLFLFSSQSSFITGQTIVADGGQVRSY